jgi:hypothetical protein
MLLAPPPPRLATHWNHMYLHIEISIFQSGVRITQVSTQLRLGVTRRLGWWTITQNPALARE